MPSMRPDGPAAQMGQLNELIDETIEKVEETILSLRKQQKRVQKKQKRRPTDSITKGAKSKLRELCDDPIVNSDATDILIEPHQHEGGEAKSA